MSPTPTYLSHSSKSLSETFNISYFSLIIAFFYIFNDKSENNIIHLKHLHMFPQLLHQDYNQNNTLDYGLLIK
ncbi:hypothetical protein BpHYR1_028710 [Brachionus plicatilis]|uniref:Uncharacterized protein n=1 Tax=Brachionus plicatilis TaxID=10195 RepID=A0A3M7Q575_BRAPC|nr:hypothetical protein BpHYR1_028710 [Brachionus plicatilis]